MFRVEKVLVPVDFSTSSRAAYAFAAGLGEKDPLIHVSHVLEPWRPYQRNVLFPYAALGEDDVEFEHELLEEARAHLFEHLDLDQEEVGDTIKALLEFGPAGETLAGQVRSLGPDLVAMGAFGKGGVRPNALGSTAMRLLEDLSCPTVLVRDYEPNPTVDHIVVAVDLTTTSSAVVAAALGLALQIDATLEIVYALADPRARDSTSLLRDHLDFDAEEMLAGARGEIEALFERMIDPVEIDFPDRERADQLLENRKVVVGDPPMAVVDHANKAGADMIAFGADTPRSATNHQLGRTARTIARCAPTHLMVIPPAR